MALTMKKSSNLTGESRIEGAIVISMSAEISSDQVGNSYVRQVINNQELYAKNRTECREDLSAFQSKVFEVEDKFIEEGFGKSE